MKTATIKNFAILFSIIAFMGVASAKAESIAILDLDNVLKNSDAMKDAQKKLSKKQSEFQKEIDKQQSTLEDESKKLNAKKNVLSKEAFDKEQEKFSKKVDTLKELVDKRQAALKKASLDAVTKINDKVKEIVEDVKDEKKLDVIISASSTVYYKDDLDISSDVLKALNKKISKVDVKF